MILEIEAVLGLGLGGFGRLPTTEQERLLAWWRIREETRSPAAAFRPVVEALVHVVRVLARQR